MIRASLQVALMAESVLESKKDDIYRPRILDVAHY